MSPTSFQGSCFRGWAQFFAFNLAIPLNLWVLKVQRIHVFGPSIFPGMSLAIFFRTPSLFHTKLSRVSPLISLAYDLRTWFEPELLHFYELDPPFCWARYEIDTLPPTMHHWAKINIKLVCSYWATHCLSWAYGHLSDLYSYDLPIHYGNSSPPELPKTPTPPVLALVNLPTSNGINSGRLML